MKRPALYGWLPVLMLGALAALTFWLDRTVKLGNVAGTRDSGAPDVIVEDFSAAIMNPDGSKRYTLLAHQMQHFTDEEITLLQSPELTHYAPGSPQVHVRSKQARVSKDAEEILFTGDVLVTRDADAKSGKLTLNTSQLSVYPDEDIARSDKEVTLSSENGTLQGVGLEFNNATRQMRLASRVRGQFKNPRSGHPQQ